MHSVAVMAVLSSGLVGATLPVRAERDLTTVTALERVLSIEVSQW